MYVANAGGVFSSYIANDIPYLAHDIPYIAHAIHYIAHDIPYIAHAISYIINNSPYIAHDTPPKKRVLVFFLLLMLNTVQNFKYLTILNTYSITLDSIVRA